MNILVLGGTQFVGRHIVQGILDAGHSVTIFSRGQTNTSLFPGVPRLMGDRNDDLTAIEEAVKTQAAAGKSFDACVDVSAYTRNHVLRSLKAVGSHVSRYLLISSISVYKAPVEPFFSESSPVEELENRDADLSNETYGGLKVVCEREVESALGDRGVMFRLGLVNGPYDHTDRATYWAVRAHRGGEIFVPAGASTPIQIIDPRDIGNAAVHALENELFGPINIVNSPTTWSEFLAVGSAMGGSTDGYLFADDQEWVESQLESIPEPDDGNERPMGPLPMFLPARYGWSFWQADNKRSLDTGISYRPIDTTVEETLTWRLEEGSPLKAGLAPNQERELIDRWQKTTRRPA